MSNINNKWRQFREIEKDEFILIFGDCSQGGEDSNFAQFCSQTKLDFPMVYQAKGVAMSMTQDLFPILEKIYDVTGVPPVVALERNNGGQSEMQRLFDLNVKNKYRIFIMPTWGTVMAEETNKLGWDTNSATRPKMLGEWKNAFEKRLFRIYDEETLNQHKSFIIKNGKAQASAHRHDDGVISCFIGKTLIKTNNGDVPISKIKVGDLVLTRGGYQPVINTFKSKKNIIRKLGLVGTPDHPIITKNGVKRLDTIVDSDIIHVWNTQEMKIEKQSVIKVKNIIDTQTLQSTNLEVISGDTINGKSRLFHYIDKFGLILMGLFQTKVKFITKMAIALIIRLKIWFVYLGLNIKNGILTNQKEKDYLEKMDSNNQKELSSNSKNGGKIIKRIVPKFIEKMLLKTFSWTLPKQLFVPSAENNLKQYAKEQSSIVADFAKIGQMKEVEKLENKTVYNLTVDNCPEYFANGILVHNCAGAYQLFQTCKPESSQAHLQAGNFKKPAWTDQLPDWAIEKR